MYEARDATFDACFRKAQAPMGALVPGWPHVCDYSTHMSVRVWM
jgi:hypothetical protein